MSSESGGIGNLALKSSVALVTSAGFALGIAANSSFDMPYPLFSNAANSSAVTFAVTGTSGRSR